MARPRTTTRTSSALPELCTALRKKLGETRVRSGKDTRDFWGASKIPPQGIVVTPRSAGAISDLLKIASSRDINVIVAGSNGHGVDIPSDGHAPFVVIDTSALDRILAIDEISCMVSVQAGLTWGTLERLLNKHQYTLGYPAGGFIEDTSLGGMLATGLPPLASPRYGSIYRRVVNVGCVLPNGDRIRTKLTPRSATGPDLKALILGGRGSLGIITGATLLIQKFPEAHHRLTYRFADTASAVGAVLDILRDGYRPALARVWRRGTASIVAVSVEGLERVARVERDVINRALLSAGGKAAEGDATDIDFSATVRLGQDVIVASANWTQGQEAAREAALADAVWSFNDRGVYLTLQGSSTTRRATRQAISKVSLTVILDQGQEPMTPVAAHVVTALRPKLDARNRFAVGRGAFGKIEEQEP